MDQTPSPATVALAARPVKLTRTMASLSPPAPNMNRPITLQHHMVREDFRELQLRECNLSIGAEQEENREAWGAAFPHGGRPKLVGVGDATNLAALSLRRCHG
jgi:hypothetical protein